MSQPDNVNSSSIATIGACGTLLTLAIIVALQGYYAKTSAVEDARKSDMLMKKAYNDLRLQQETSMDTYRWLDKEKQVVGLPIEVAMQVVTNEIHLQPEKATPPMPEGVQPTGAAVPPAANEEGSVDGAEVPAEGAAPAEAPVREVPPTDPEKDAAEPNN